jgi:hypothetical protein
VVVGFTKLLAAAALTVLACAAQTRDPASQKPDPEDAKTYIKNTFSPTGIVEAGLGATITQGTNTPSEWGQGAVGFAKRFGSAMGKRIVKRGIQYPVARAFHEEIHYRRSDKTGFGPRLKYALTSVVITHKTTDGKPTVAKGEIAGAFGSGLISRLWQPASTRTIGLGFTSGGITLGVDAAGNVFREFWPEIRHPHTHGMNPSRPNSQTSGAELLEPELPEVEH